MTFEEEPGLAPIGPLNGSPPCWPRGLRGLLDLAAASPLTEETLPVLGDLLLEHGHPWGEVLAGARSCDPELQRHQGRFQVRPLAWPRELRLLRSDAFTRDELAACDNPSLHVLRRLSFDRSTLGLRGWHRYSELLNLDRFPWVEEIDLLLDLAFWNVFPRWRCPRVRCLHVFSLGRQWLHGRRVREGAEALRAALREMPGVQRIEVHVEPGVFPSRRVLEVVAERRAAVIELAHEFHVRHQTCLPDPMASGPRCRKGRAPSGRRPEASA